MKRGAVLIKQMDISKRVHAEAVLQVQIPSYKVEAQIIGSDDIPPLKDTVEKLQTCGEIFFGYYLNGELCGAISYKLEADEIDIHRLIVHPNHFRKGIAQKLLDFVESAVEFKKMKVSTGMKNEPAVRFYHKNGFKVVNEVKINENLYITIFEKKHMKQLKRRQFMLAKLEKIQDGYIAEFNRSYNQTIDQVWGTLTENRKLKGWMSNLQIVELRKGGTIKFNMNDGTDHSFDMMIIDYAEKSLLQFEWGDGSVRFEVFPKNEVTVLKLKEYIPALSDHTAKDLAGWHICLEMFDAVLKGQFPDFPKGEWESWHKEYKELINPFR